MGDVNEEVAEDLENGADTPRSDSYTINGQPGDFCECSKGTWTHTLNEERCTKSQTIECNS